MSAARSLDAAMKRIDEIRARQAWVLAPMNPGGGPVEGIACGSEAFSSDSASEPCACDPDESCQECDAA